jgi:hypothetical protein
MERGNALQLACRQEPARRLRLMTGLTVSAAGAVALASEALHYLARLG